MSEDDELGSMKSLLTAMASTRSSPALSAGTLVAEQYEIERTLGEGAMGVVYLARDRRLDRSIALKVGITMSAPSLARIEREAKALAKLSHPNVVVVYQVGAIDGRVFIAMEHVAGGTARTWLEAKPRTWREICELYAAVGDGLAAAHRAGLVHRDFKPENVLVGDDGRPRIADFGVARTIDADPSGEGSGALVGTPAYMPPEQLAGHPVDARADQYSFAATVWEALFGTRPEPDPEPPEHAGEVPRFVIKALRRALAKDPTKRWPELSPLISELRPRARRRILIAVAATAVVAASAVAISLSVTADDPPCEDAAARITDVWNANRRAQLAKAAGPLAWPAIERAVDARVKDWIATHGAACKATRIDQLASEPLLDRRMFCLASSKAELQATLRLVESGSKEALSHVAPFLSEAPVPADCLGPLDEEPLPADPEIRRKIDATVTPMAEAEAAMFDRGLLDPLDKTEHVLALARETGWRPLIARALSVRGWVLVEHEKFAEAWPLLDEAARLALASRADRRAVYAMADGAHALAWLGRMAEAQQALSTATSLWERIGKPAPAGLRLYNAVAEVALRAGKPAEVLVAVREQITLSEKAYGDDAVEVAARYFNLSVALLGVGELTAAADAADQSIKRYEAALGEHPSVGKAHFQAAATALRRGKIDDAVSHATASIAITERWFGATDSRLVRPLSILGNAHLARGKLDLAASASERALAILRANDPKSIQIAPVEQGLAIIALRRGDLAEASKRANAALASAEATLGADHLELIDFLAVVAAIAREGQKPDLVTSEQLLQRAQTIAAKHLPDGHRRRINLTIERSYTQTMAGKAADAIAALEPELARIDKLDVGVQTPHELAFALAKAHAARGEKKRACELATRSETGYAAVAPPMAKQVATWRSTNCPSK